MAILAVKTGAVDPWAFIDPVDLAEGYEIYNLPLLQGIKSLPAMITKKVSGVEYIQHVMASIQNSNVDRILTAFEYPAIPETTFNTM